MDLRRRPRHDDGDAIRRGPALEVRRVRRDRVARRVDRDGRAVRIERRRHRTAVRRSHDRFAVRHERVDAPTRGDVRVGVVGQIGGVETRLDRAVPQRAHLLHRLVEQAIGGLPLLRERDLAQRLRHDVRERQHDHRQQADRDGQLDDGETVGARAGSCLGAPAAAVRWHPHIQFPPVRGFLMGIRGDPLAASRRRLIPGNLSVEGTPLSSA